MRTRNPPQATGSVSLSRNQARPADVMVRSWGVGWQCAPVQPTSVPALMAPDEDVTHPKPEGRAEFPLPGNNWEPGGTDRKSVV